jgi:hypothetical protein
MNPMPADFAKVPLLDRLYKLRREGRRIFSSIITTYSINLPFYENVVLRHLQAAGSRLNVVLVDDGELGRAFVAESTAPRRAGVDYVLIPVCAGGAFHPKIVALFSDQGMIVALGSHNLTEAGFGRNSEISITFGFDKQVAPISISRPIADYVLQCAGDLAPGDAALSRRLAERLELHSRRGANADHDVAFVGARPGGTTLLAGAFKDSEFASAKRILVLGPYFDDDLRFLGELRKRAPAAQLVVALQPEHSVMKRPGRVPARTRLCNADVLALRQSATFIHAKAIVLDAGKQAVAAIGSANPSYPAWFGNSARGNFEAVVTMRGEAARKAIRELALDQLWGAPVISESQLKQIESRSQKATSEDDSATPTTLAGLWREGWVKAELRDKSRAIRAVRQLSGPTYTSLPLEGASITEGALRFAAPGAGIFAVDMSDHTEPVIVIASSAGELGSTLVSGTAARLIDELGRLGGGTAPGEELLDLCEKVLLQPKEEDEGDTTRRPSRRTAASTQQSGNETYSPRGISIHDGGVSSHRSVTVDLDISAIITLLLKELETEAKEKGDPTVEDEDATEDETPDTESAANKVQPRAQWEDIVRAIRPRVRRLLNRLANRIEEAHSAKWKYERVLVTLALMKRLRKFHPGSAIPFAGVPKRLVDDEQLREAFKLAMHCWFARDGGVIGALERMGGIDSEHEIMGRALLLWAAYEAGADVARSASAHMEPEEFRTFQADRTDALISAIAASASPETLERARHEIFDRGMWAEPCDHVDRIDAWFRRHTQIGQSLQRALVRSRPPRLPVMARTPSIEDIVVWKQEPGWPRFPEVVTGRVVHLADVGDEEPIKIAQQFVQPVDIDGLGIRIFLTPHRLR